MLSWTDLLYTNCRLSPERFTPFDGRPRIVVFNATSRCNLKCSHCYYDARGVEGFEELDTQAAIDFIKDLAESGASTLIFSGGEPLLRKDIFRLIEFAEDRGIRTALSTNGTLLTEETAQDIKRSGCSYIGVSLDGMETINDSFRRNEGAFRLSLSGIRNCKKIGLRVGLRFTLTKHNLTDLPQVFELVEKESIPRLCIYHLVYTGRGSGLKYIDLDSAEKREAMEFIWNKCLDFHGKGLDIEILTVDNHADGVWLYLKLKEENPERAQEALRLLKLQGGNSSGMKIGAVDDSGYIYADQFFRNHPLGNIREMPFSEVWKDGNDGLLRDLRRNRRRLIKGRCRECDFFAICNGNFRARAEAAFGDVWQEDPACYLTEDEIYETEFASSFLGDDEGL